jgi:hypothetical protein
LLDHRCFSDLDKVNHKRKIKKEAEMKHM